MRIVAQGVSIGVAALCFGPGLAAPAAESVDVPAGATAEALSFVLHSGTLPKDGRWKSTPLLADLNADGMPDLAAHPRVANGARVWLGDGKGNWREASAGLQMEELSCGGGIESADVNRDGKPDLVVADHCQGLYVYLGDGQGGWTAVTQRLAPALSAEPNVEIGNVNPFAGAEDVAVGDLDGDGDIDLVATSSDRGGFSVYLGDGTGKSWSESAGHGLPRGAEIPEKDDKQRGGWANELLLHDMDGDGHLDLVAAYYLGPRVWRGDGKGKFSAWSEGLPVTTEGGTYRRIAVGDLDRDGRPDIAVSRMTGTVGVFLQRPEGGFQDVTPELPPAVQVGSEGIAIGDIDGDGHAELVLGVRPLGSEEGYGLAALARGPAGGWETVPAAGLPEGNQQVIWGIAIADADRDGRNDLAVTIGGEMWAPRPAQASADGSAAGPKPEPLPHVQVWLNQGKTSAQAATDPDSQDRPADGDRAPGSDSGLAAAETSR